MKHGDYGYSILDADNDSVRLYNKEIGKAPVKKFAYAISTDFTPIINEYVQANSHVQHLLAT